MKMGGVMLGSAEPTTLAEFYKKILGETSWQEDDWTGFDIGGTFLVIGPHSEVKPTSVEPQRSMVIFESDDVKSDFERVRELGAEVVAEPYQPVMADKGDNWLCTLADPDGNYFQIGSKWEV